MSGYGQYTTVVAELERGVLTVTLNRPDKMNSADQAMVDELNEVFERSRGDGEVRCLLLTGAGAAFCAGRDISDADPNEDAYEIITKQFNPLLGRVFHYPKPTVAAVNGAAMGVGLGLALACDIVIAADNAKFSSPFARLGVALDSGGHYFLPRRVGYHRAVEMAFTSDIVRGRQAEQWGLVNRSVAGARLMAHATQLAQRIADGPVNAFIGQKQLLKESEALGYDEVCAREASLQASLMGKPEYEEGLAAFNEKRAPSFAEIPLPNN